MSIVELMAAPFAECLVLVAIHTYLGIHVLKRRVIFVDLALAQIAALGTTVGFLFGIMPETSGALLFSMAFTFVGAAVFSLTRFRQERVPQEAVIGLTYAISCAIAVLVVEKTQGAEHLKDILVGNLLWVTWADVGVAAAVYLVIGAVHVVFRRQFLLISDDPAAAYAQGLTVRAWDFLFYLTFGAVITFSTRVAGVLLVFVFLVAPAILAFIITTRMSRQLVIGWVTGTVVTVVGLYLSWHLDLPSGPAVIAFYGVALVLGALGVYLWRAPDRLLALRRVGLGVTAAGAVSLLLWTGGRALGDSSLSVSDEAREVAAGVTRDLEESAQRESAALAERQQQLFARVARCVGPNKVTRYLAQADPELQLEHARRKLGEHPRRGLELLLLVLSDDEQPRLYREEAVELLREAAGKDFGYDPALGADENEPAREQLCLHLRGLKQQESRATAGDD